MVVKGQGTIAMTPSLAKEGVSAAPAWATQIACLQELSE
jgi:hypothetical protein